MTELTTLKVCEVFTSIQGETTFAGLPCAFVRLTGCNLRCAYCDTRYAYDEGADTPVAAIVRDVLDTGMDLVGITGGEPLLQPAVHTLAAELLGRGKAVLIETNGSVSIEGIDPRAVLILDVKTPGSGMSERMDLQNLRRIRPNDEVKFVLTDRRDYDWAKAMVHDHGLTGRCAVLFSPAYGLLRPSVLVAWMMEDRLAVRLNLQLHKYIWPPDTRGV